MASTNRNSSGSSQIANGVQVVSKAVKPVIDYASQHPKLITGALVYASLLSISKAVKWFRNRVRSHTLLEVHIQGTFIDVEQSWPAKVLKMKKSILTLRDIILAAKDDSKIDGLIVTIGHFQLSMARLDEICEAISFFRQKKGPKSTLAYVSHWTVRPINQYLLAVACGRIYCPPSAALLLAPLSAERPFFKDILNEWGIQFFVEKRRGFKGAANSLTEDKFTKEDGIVINEVLTGLEKDFEQRMRRFRQNCFKNGTTPESVLAEGPYMPNEAVSKGLINKLIHIDEIYDKPTDFFGPKEASTNFQRLLPSVYYNVQGVHKLYTTGKTKVAIVRVRGILMHPDVQMGFRFPGQKYDVDIAVRCFRKISKDKTIKAVILDINTRGGSVEGSEYLGSAIEHCRKTGKFVVAVMGGVCASGGYWAAACCDKIVCGPRTITGSIGIIWARPSTADAMKNWRINWDQISHDKRGLQLFNNFVNRLTTEDKALVAKYIDYGYNSFKEVVGKGRNMSLRKVEEVAQGRVFLGREAQKRGLVDHLGSRNTALHLIDNHLNKAGIPLEYKDDFLTGDHGPVKPSNFRLIPYPEKKKLIAAITAQQRTRDDIKPRIMEDVLTTVAGLCLPEKVLQMVETLWSSIEEETLNAPAAVEWHCTSAMVNDM